MFLLIWLMGNYVSSETTSSGATTGQGSTFSMLLPFIALFAIIYFMMIRPSKKRDKETKSMLAALKKGDKIVTIGGIRGTVVSVKESTVVIKVDSNASIEFNKTAIAQVLSSSSSYEEKVEKAIEKPTEKESGKTSKKQTSKKKTQKDKIKVTKAPENFSANESDIKTDNVETSKSETSN